MELQKSLPHPFYQSRGWGGSWARRLEVHPPLPYPPGEAEGEKGEARLEGAPRMSIFLKGQAKKGCYLAAFGVTGEGPRFSLV